MEEAIEQIDIGGPSMLRRQRTIVMFPWFVIQRTMIMLRAMESGEEELAKLRRELALKVLHELQNMIPQSQAI